MASERSSGYFSVAQRIFSFNFSYSEYLEEVLYEDPWMFGKTSLTLIKWSSKLELQDSSFFYSAPVWVRLPSLPLEFWVEDVFKGITISFGELLATNPMTAARKRLVYARIYVNVCHSLDLPLSIDILSKLERWEKTIEYEFLPFVFFHCKKVGH